MFQASCFQLLLLAHSIVTQHALLGGALQKIGESTANTQKVSRGEYTTKTLPNKGNFYQILFLTQPTIKMEGHGIAKPGKFPQG